MIDEFKKENLYQLEKTLKQFPNLNQIDVEVLKKAYQRIIFNKKEKELHPFNAWYNQPYFKHNPNALINQQLSDSWNASLDHITKEMETKIPNPHSLELVMQIIEKARVKYSNPE